VVVVVISVALCRPTLRRRALAAGAAALAALVPLLVYAAIYNSENDHFGLTRASSWNLYGRVAPFADCGRFDPPAGTRVLCQTTPADERLGPTHWIFGLDSPGVVHLGGPQGPPSSTDKVNSFTRRTLTAQPLDYLAAVGSDLRRYVTPGCCYRRAFGESPDGLVEDYLLQQYPREVAPYWSSQGYAVSDGSIDALAWYERHTRFDGVLMVLALLLALAGPLLARRGARLFPALFAGLALASMLAPVATLHYDARLAVPSFGLLGLAAGTGAWVAYRRFRMAPSMKPRMRDSSG
jgi:hypothetical protein